MLVSSVAEGSRLVSKVKIVCDNMEVVSEIIQDLVKFFNIAELESEAEFPAELHAFEEIINQVAECNATRIKLAADMADESQRIKVE
jgi:hypothetical protein